MFYNKPLSLHPWVHPLLGWSPLLSSFYVPRSVNLIRLELKPRKPLGRWSSCACFSAYIFLEREREIVEEIDRKRVTAAYSGNESTRKRIESMQWKARERFYPRNRLRFIRMGWSEMQPVCYSEGQFTPEALSKHFFFQSSVWRPSFVSDRNQWNQCSDSYRKRFTFSTWKQDIKTRLVLSVSKLTTFTSCSINTQRHTHGETIRPLNLCSSDVLLAAVSSAFQLFLRKRRSRGFSVGGEVLVWSQRSSSSQTRCFTLSRVESELCAGPTRFSTPLVKSHQGLGASFVHRSVVLGFRLLGSNQGKLWSEMEVIICRCEQWAGKFVFCNLSPLTSEPKAASAGSQIWSPFS